MNILQLALTDPMVMMELSHSGIFIHQEDNGLVLTYHLADEVKEPSAYTQVLELIRTLSSDDVFEIIISGSPGGRLSGARVITTAMDTTTAHTCAVVIDNIASAATMVAVSADELIMTPGSSMMIHSASYGAGGKASDVEAQVHFQTKDIKRTIKSLYKDFLTKDEIKLIIAGKELWMDEDECTERFTRLSEKRQKRADKERIEMLKEQKTILEEQLVLIQQVIDAN